MFNIWLIMYKINIIRLECHNIINNKLDHNYLHLLLCKKILNLKIISIINKIVIHKNKLIF